ncbi:FadR/GntR family transcriptional regulator [Sphingobium sp.]|uniref:FadR/GntR family transcriptional regulator n=1 Tax=Sphingobium sp. TaxID=1912891 RepID=UPI002CC83F73|nr:FCD domain-containing protein [Sphingobium sp.]HUD93917.1 FCD domain-containing protein [Sphingobium sp.]
MVVDVSGNSLTHATVQSLRELALSVPKGHFLGTEKDLLARFHISRPTFRQAVHILESERLVAKVRGLNGGLFSRSPDLEGVVASAATYLRSHTTTLGDILGAVDSTMADAVGLAARCEDPELRARLAAMIDDFKAGEMLGQSVADFRQDELRAVHHICEMCGNPAVDLMVRVLYQVGITAFGEIFEGREALMQARRTSRVQMLRAILSGDHDMAVELTRRGGADARNQIAEPLLNWPLSSVSLKGAQD